MRIDISIARYKKKGCPMVPATVHAALVVVFVYLLQLAATALGVNVTESALTEIATLIVGYILSLGGLAVFRRATTKNGVLPTDDGYKPPFT